MPAEIEWHEVTLENRPPQNRPLLWYRYHAMRDGSWFPAGMGVGTYRFGMVKGPGGHFGLPSKSWAPSALQAHRFFWAEMIPRPHECGLIGPIWEPEE